MKENYKVIDLKKAYSKKGVEYYYVCIYVTRDNYISDVLKIFITQKFYEYLLNNYKSLDTISVQDNFVIQYDGKIKAFQLVQDSSLLK